MIKVGSYNKLKVEKQTSFGFYLTDGVANVLMPNKYAPEGLRIDDELEVFIYADSEDRPLATTLTPKAVAGEIAALKVKIVNQVGAFLDWGLEKDLFVPFGEQLEKMIAGRTYCVRVMLDELTNRVIATSKLKKHLQPVPRSFTAGREVEIIVVRVDDTGADVVADKKYSGKLYSNEIFEELHSGDCRKAYIKKVRADGRLDLSLQKQGYHAVVGDATETILTTLKAHDGFIGVNDKTPPAEIEKLFHMSKKTFKKALGSLYKTRVVTVEESGITLLK